MLKPTEFIEEEEKDNEISAKSSAWPCRSLQATAALAAAMVVRLFRPGGRRGDRGCTAGHGVWVYGDSEDFGTGSALKSDGTGLDVIAVKDTYGP